MIAERLALVNQRIIAAEKAANRPPQSVQLLTVSKQQPVSSIRVAYNAGQRAFGENYLQEALQKIAALSNLEIEWHFIGRIQSNKTTRIAENFSWVHTVASAKAAKRLSDARPEAMPPLNVCIQVNLDNETQKAGVPLAAVADLAAYIQQFPKIYLRGLMALPAAGLSVLEKKARFTQLAQLQSQLNEKGAGLDTLSMGMSGDFEEAIFCGSTVVRVGSLLFGPRTT